jgi:hypothetical protein
MQVESVLTLLLIPGENAEVVNTMRYVAAKSAVYSGTLLWRTPMSAIAKQQVHEKFKVFVGDLAQDKTLGKLAGQVSDFASGAKIAAKSIGVEYLESLKKLVVTLGYRDDEPFYPIEIHAVPLGKIQAMGDDFSALENAMAAASRKHPNIICHELYVTGEHDFILVFMTHRA